MLKKWSVRCGGLGVLLLGLDSRDSSVYVRILGWVESGELVAQGEDDDRTGRAGMVKGGGC